MRKNQFAVYVFLISCLLFIQLPLMAGDKKYPGENDFVITDTPAMMKSQIVPIYPADARDKNMEAVVWVKALVDDLGLVVEAKIMKCSAKDLGFEEAALEAAKKSEFSPAMKDGKPVSVWVAYKVEFKLDGEKGK
jgi:TonB family protein